jgi:hypothetical protein
MWIRWRPCALLSGLLGRRVGPSTGTNFAAMLALADEMRARGEQGSILSLLCDRASATYGAPSSGHSLPVHLSSSTSIWWTNRMR